MRGARPSAPLAEPLGGGVPLLKTERWGMLVALILGWLLASCALVYTLMRLRLAEDLRRSSAALEQHADAVSYQFDRSIAFLYGVPATFADDPEVRDLLAAQSRSPFRPGAGVLDKRAALVSVPGYATLNRHLATLCRELGIDIVWVVNASGDCVASANFATTESFVGVNYADRAYFRSAMAGLRGRQYAVGRTTNIPGIFFSAPIEADGKRIGAVVAKIDVSRLSQWLNRFDCFITDESGVIILSSEPGLEYRAIAGAAVYRTPPEDLERKYKRRQFPALEVGQVDPRLAPYTSAYFPGSSSPFMLALRPRREDGYRIYAFAQVPGIGHQGELTLGLAALVFTAGAALILLIWGFRDYLHHLRQAMAASQAASRSKGEFLATMSHEIRTPMNGIIGLARLVLDTPLNDEQLAYMTSLRTSADNLLRILNDILDFSKIEAGRIDLESVPFSLKNRVQDTLRPFQVKAQENGVSLELEIEPSVPDALVGDPVRLCQVLNNLLGNALKFTHRGRVALGCRLAGEQEAGVLLRFSVADTGIGISPGELSRIFEKFTQADSSTTRVYGGTGLGLAISRRLTELMGGSLSVESVLGEGSTFSFTLPLGVAGPEERVDPQPLAAAFKAGRDLRILVVDDIPTNQLVARKTIAKTGDHRIECAGNGVEAVEKWRQDDFDLIFMDVQMPLMDGLEATRAIRAQERASGKRVPICAMTANAMKEDKAICEQAGMDFYISKPILAEDIHGILRLITQDADRP